VRHYRVALADISRSFALTYVSGFIQALATIEFDNSYSSAHTVADTGGEFVVAKELDLSFILVRNVGS